MSLEPSTSEGVTAVSVVIPAFNEARYLRRTMDSLCAQTLSPGAFEVIVVDNGSTDGTMELALEFKERFSLRVVRRTGCRIAAVRNYGASLATGTVLAFLDADCIAPRDWLEHSLAVAPLRGVWGAHYLVPLDSTWVGRVWFEHQARSQEGAISFLPGGCLFMRRPDFMELGGFGENLETSEDVDLCQRARSCGMSVLGFPALAVYHEGTAQTLRHFYRQNRWHGATVLRIFLANLPSTANLPLVALSIYTLLLFWATLLFVLSFPLTRHILPSLLCLCLLLAPALVLSAVKIVRTRRWTNAGPLFVLYLTYLLARAASLTRLSSRNHR